VGDAGNRIADDEELTAKPFKGLVHSVKISRGQKTEKQIRQLYEKAI
jgi:hypothetical protein